MRWLDILDDILDLEDNSQFQLGSFSKLPMLLVMMVALSCAISIPLASRDEKDEKVISYPLKSIRWWLVA